MLLYIVNNMKTLKATYNPPFLYFTAYLQMFVFAVLSKFYEDKYTKTIDQFYKREKFELDDGETIQPYYFLKKMFRIN